MQVLNLLQNERKMYRFKNGRVSILNLHFTHMPFSHLTYNYLYFCSDNFDGFNFWKFTTMHPKQVIMQVAYSIVTNS